MIFFLCYQVALFYTVTRLVLYYNLSAACSLAVLIETTRFVMKTYSFVRGNAPKVQHKFKEKVQEPLPTFNWYQYFLFCPTLLYRHSYPRTSSIRWLRVCGYLLEMLLVILCMSFTFERFAVPYFGRFGETEATAASLVKAIFSSILPGITVFMCVFYSVLHVWMNLWAEMLRFADRSFYSDWWTATSFDVYYRKWNYIVHEWLYEYVYKEVAGGGGSGGQKKKVSATITVFMLSALIHEYILALSFRFFYPVLFLSFGGLGLAMMFLPLRRWNSMGNIILWTCLLLGNGVQAALYTMEHFARKNCQVGDDLVDYLVPVSWSCVPKNRD